MREAKQGRWVARGSGLVFVIAAALLAATALARPGNLDPSFGDGGTVLTSINSQICKCGESEYVTHVLALGRGKTVAAGTSNGDLALAMYDRNGQLDPSFGGDGKVSLHLRDLAERGDQLFPADLARQPDGKLVLAANEWFLARYNRDGTRDTSFGGDGIVPIFFGRGIGGVAVQRDGKIVVAGTSGRGDYHVKFVRLLPDGRIDRNFGEARGETDVHSYRGDSTVEALVIRRDGKIVGVGDAQIPGGAQHVFVVRLRPNGYPDPRWGGEGIVQTRVGSSSYGRDLALYRDGRVVVAGDNDADRFFLVRYLSSGKLDRRFGGGDGFVRVARKIRQGRALGVALAGGRILLTGVGRPLGFKLWGYEQTGQLDPSFGSNGRVITRIGESGGGSFDVAVHPFGRIVLGGSATVANESQFALAGYRTGPR